MSTASPNRENAAQVREIGELVECFIHLHAELLNAASVGVLGVRKKDGEGVHL